MAGARDTLNQTRDVRTDTDGRLLIRSVDSTGADTSPVNIASAVALITHTAASVGVNSADQINSNARGVSVGVNITAGTGTTPTLQVIIEGRDVVSGSYYTLLASAAIAATPGFTLLQVYPGLVAVAGLVANQALPRVWRVRTVIGGTTPAVTATISANLSL